MTEIMGWTLICLPVFVDGHVDWAVFYHPLSFEYIWTGLRCFVDT